jgi:zinc and cadmium transporter
VVEAHSLNGLIAAVIAAAVSTAGLLSMAALRDWGLRNAPYFSAFALGVLLIAVFFHIIPEALEVSLDSWRWILVGIGAMVLIGTFVRLIHGQRDGAGAKIAIGYASIFSLGTHSFLDGLFYESTFREGLFTGGLASVGLLLHEFPEGVIAYFLLRQAGVGMQGSIFWAFIAASLTTVLGAIAAALTIMVADITNLGMLLGLTAGGLIYIMAFRLAPHATLTPYRRGYAAVSLGIAIGVAAIVLRGGGH